jgi:hypothetical protein
MPTAKNNCDSILTCRMCGVSSPTREEKERHLREHMKGRHPREATGAVFWQLQEWVASTDGEAGGLSEDERDLIEYCREHPGRQQIIASRSNGRQREIWAVQTCGARTASGPV